MTDSEQRRAAQAFADYWRGKGGMHYTSIENIHKVIDPLFLTALKKELADALAISVDKTRDAALQAFRHKLASLRFLDIKTPRLIQFNYSSAVFVA